MSDLTITDFVGEAWWFIAAVLIVGFAIQGVQRRRIRKRFGTGHRLHNSCEILGPVRDRFQLCAEGIYGPTDRSYWVVEGRFAAGAYPSKPGYTGSGQIPKPLELLLDTGIDVFINLTQDYPGGTDKRFTDSRYDPGAEGRAEIARYPVPDLHLPSCPLVGTEAGEAARRMHLTEEGCPHCPNDQSRAETRKILDRIDAALDEGQNVYVHCWGGSGRTGTVVGCWLRRHDFVDADNVLGRLKILRRGDRKGWWKPTPNTEEQRKFIKGWEIGE